MALNSFCAQGRLASDVRTYNIDDERRAVATFSFAVNRNYKDKSGDRPTDFLFCKGFGKTAQFIDKYFNKGDVAIISNAEIRRDDDYEKDGEKVYGELYVHLNIGSIMFNEQNRDSGGSSQSDIGSVSTQSSTSVSNNPLAAAMNKKDVI